MLIKTTRTFDNGITKTGILKIEKILTANDTIKGEANIEGDIPIKYPGYKVISAYSGWEKGNLYYLLPHNVMIGDYRNGSPEYAGTQDFMPV